MQAFGKTLGDVVMPQLRKAAAPDADVEFALQSGQSSLDGKDARWGREASKSTTANSISELQQHMQPGSFYCVKS